MVGLRRSPERSLKWQKILETSTGCERKKKSYPTKKFDLLTSASLVEIENVHQVREGPWGKDWRHEGGSRTNEEGSFLVIPPGLNDLINNSEKQDTDKGREVMAGTDGKNAKARKTERRFYSYNSNRHTSGETEAVL